MQRAILISLAFPFPLLLGIKDCLPSSLELFLCICRFSAQVPNQSIKTRIHTLSEILTVQRLMSRHTALFLLDNLPVLVLKRLVPHWAGAGPLEPNATIVPRRIHRKASVAFHQRVAETASHPRAHPVDNEVPPLLHFFRGTRYPGCLVSGRSVAPIVSTRGKNWAALRRVVVAPGRWRRR
jgi:hypothetical protein